MTSKKSNDERIENIQSNVEENYDDIQRLRDKNKKLLKRIQLIEEFIRKQSKLNEKIVAGNKAVAGNQARIIKLKT